MMDQLVRKPFYKRILAALLLLVLAIAPMTGSLAAEYTTVINPYSSSNVNLRNAPGFDGEVLASYPAGTPVEILAHGTWMHVRIQGSTGYIHADFVNLKNITATQSKPSKPEASKDEYLYVKTSNGGNLNLRAKPSSDGDIIGSYAPGTRVKVLLKGQSWYKVEVGSNVGYMRSSFLSKDKPATSSTGNANNSGTKEILASGVVSISPTTQTVNLRQSASLTAKVLGQYKNGTKLYVFSKTGDWYKVCIGDTIGYMMSKYVTVGTQTASSAKYMTVVNNNGGSYVNVRAFAGMHYKVITTAKVGTKVEVIEKGEFWTRVNVSGTVGYMNNYFLK